MTTARVFDLQGEVSNLRRELEAKQRELDDTRRRLDESPELRGHKTWGITELSRALFDARTTGEVLPTDQLVLLCLYSMCRWPGEAAPPESASTAPISYDFLGAKVGLARSGVEKAVRRLRERGWLETERDPASGYLVYTLEIGQMLDDLATLGSWTTQDAKSSRPPSRRSTVMRGQRWEGRSPALPTSPRSTPRSPEAARLIREWRRTWLGTADPTAAINRLLGDGIPEKEIRRAMRSMENLARPRPEFLQDRVARTDYQRPMLPPDRGEDRVEAEPSVRSAEALGGSGSSAQRPELDTLPPDPVSERPPEAVRQRLSARLEQFLAEHGPDPSRSASRSTAPAIRARRSAPAGSADSGMSSSRAGPDVSTECGIEKWTAAARGDTTAAGHVPERARAANSRTSAPPEKEGEL